MTVLVAMGFPALPILVRLLSLHQPTVNLQILWGIAFRALIGFTSVLMEVPVCLLLLYARLTIKLASACLVTLAMFYCLILLASKRPLQMDVFQPIQQAYATPVPPNSSLVQAESAMQGTATAYPMTNQVTA